MMRSALALVAVLGCTASGGAQHAPRAARTALDADELQAALSYANGGRSLLDRLDEDGWWIHHGATEPLRGRAALSEYLNDLRRAYPRLDMASVRAVPLGEDAWVVELEASYQGVPTGPLVALVRTQRGAIASVEIFGTDPRDTTAQRSPPIMPADAPPLALSAEASGAVDRLARMVAGRLGEGAPPRRRLSAEGGDLSFAVFVVELPGDRGMTLTRHVAALARTEAGRIVDARIFENPREGGLTEMGNLWAARDQLQSRVDADALVWGAWQGFCCEQGDRTRSCRRTSTRALDACREVGRLALVCREAYHCTGAECFCCSNGIDAACSMDHVPEETIEVPKGRRPPEPSIWSPY
jgi:hypothetical protein